MPEMPRRSSAPPLRRPAICHPPRYRFADLRGVFLWGVLRRAYFVRRHFYECMIIRGIVSVISIFRDRKEEKFARNQSENAFGRLKMNRKNAEKQGFGHKIY